MHVIAAVTDTTVVTFVVQTMTIKSEDFQGLISGAIEELSKRLVNEKRAFVLFYDNAAVHKTKAVKEELIRSGCLAI